MNGLLKWLLAPAVLMAGLAFVGTDRAEAARWRVHVRYPGYHATYVHRGRYPAYHYGPVYRWAPAVRVYTYRPAPVVAYPAYPYVPAPVVRPRPLLYYHVW